MCCMFSLFSISFAWFFNKTILTYQTVTNNGPGRWLAPWEASASVCQTAMIESFIWTVLIYEKRNTVELKLLDASCVTVILQLIFEGLQLGYFTLLTLDPALAYVSVFGGGGEFPVLDRVKKISKYLYRLYFIHPPNREQGIKHCLGYNGLLAFLLWQGQTAHFIVPWLMQNQQGQRER